MELSWLGSEPRTPVERFLCQAVEALRRAGIPFWLCGSYALEAYAGRPLREHKDADFLARAADGPRLVVCMAGLGGTIHSSDPWTLHVYKADRCLADMLLLQEHRLGSPFLDSPGGVTLLPPNSLTDGALVRMWGRQVPLVSLEGLYVLKTRRRSALPSPGPHPDEDLSLLRRLLSRSRAGDRAAGPPSRAA